MRVLVAEANAASADLLTSIVEQHGWFVETVQSGSRVLDLVAAKDFDVLMLELNLPEMDGFEILQKVRHVAPHLKVIMISGSIGVSEAVKAMKLGATHAFSKPFSVEELTEALVKIAEGMGSTPPPSESQTEMVAVSSAMRETSNMLRNIAKSKTTTVLITGETGTGKEVVARRLHKLSDRHDKPFVAVNCSAIPATLIESELFGHERGAFTDARTTRKGYFEVAADGTIFLDEIGDLSLELQVKLLRVLQERSFRRVGGSQEIPLQARIIAATNVDLASAVRKGKFREDLYYRLAVIPIHLLPLNKRPADIVPLAERFIRHFAKELGVDPPAMNEEHTRQLIAYQWPGNVRELRNVIERFVLMGGQLQFVEAARAPSIRSAPDLEALAEDLENEPSEVGLAEKKMLYKLLLRKLLASEAPEKIGSLAT